MKTPYMRFIIAVCLMTSLQVQSCPADPDSLIIQVHFLHGSKPKHQFRHEEGRWFGGILGGHAGVEYAPGKIINFQPRARFHLFSHRRLINSCFSLHDTISFYEILGSNYSDVKKTVVCLRISAAQKARLDSAAAAYLARSPYDYAFFGMRCGAATYDLLAEAGVLRAYSFHTTWARFFYPRKTRRRLERLAKEQGSRIIRSEGSVKRIWERN